MAERVVTIKLQAVATGLVQGFGRAQDAVGEFQAKTMDSARTQREEWAKVGTGLTAVGVAITGVGAAALKTGIQYNTLQQTSRAALTSLLGSAEAANAQMDKLDDFARNSPFSKATFITAQQQMLAFGIEAKKVVPYLDAVQNAVAAAGGSNTDIEGIVATMSKIQSSAKITAEDLNEFGGRGVNAAELIGSQMGKTGAQIREDITSGTINAGQALDALAAGMSKTYAGAADNVKDTFAGSLDRVKAAWRDFSAELARPLVDPNGGGALVDLLNWAADAMRAFEDLPGPIKTTISGLTGLVGVGALAGGTFLLALPKILEFRSALAGIGGVSGVAKKGLSGVVSFLTSRWVVGLIAAAAAMAVFNRAVEEGKTPQTEFSAALTQTTNLVDALQIATSNTKTNFWTDGFRESLKDLPGLMDRVMAANDDMMLITGFADAKALENLKQMGVELAAIGKTDFASVQSAFVEMSDGMDELQVEELLNQMPELRAEFAKAAGDIGLAASEGNVLALAMGDIDYGATKSAQSLEGIAGVAVDTTAAIAKLAEEISNFGAAQIDADRAAIDLQNKIRSLSEIVNEGVGSLDIYTEAGGNTASALLDVAESAKQQAEAMLIAGESQDVVNGLLESAREHLINQRIALGEDADAARAWADARVPSAADVAASLDGVKVSAEAIPADVPVKVSAETGTAAGQLSDFKQMLASIDRDVVVDVSIRGGSQGDGYVGGGGGGGFSGGRALGGIIGYAGGGIIPGYDPVKRDTVLTPMRKGEGVLVPEVVRALGAGFVHRLNAAGNNGGVSAVQSQFASMRASDFVSSPPQPIIVQAPTSGAAGAQVSMTVYPRPGMSEAEVGQVAADKVSWALKR